MFSQALRWCYWIVCHPSFNCISNSAIIAPLALGGGSSESPLTKQIKYRQSVTGSHPFKIATQHLLNSLEVKQGVHTHLAGKLCWKMLSGSHGVWSWPGIPDLCADKLFLGRRLWRSILNNQNRNHRNGIQREMAKGPSEGFWKQTVEKCYLGTPYVQGYTINGYMTFLKFFY